MSIEKLKKEYAKQISILEHYLEFTNKSYNDNSLNIHLESVIEAILNSTFDWKLTNMSKTSRNYKGYDLYDSKNKIAVQVTSNTRFDKIKHTIIETIQNSSFSIKDDKLIIFYLKRKPNLNSNQKAQIELITSNKLIFNESNLYDFSDLVDYLSKDFDKFRFINNYLLEALDLVRYDKGNNKTLGISVLCNNLTDKNYNNIVRICQLFIKSSYTIYCNKNQLMDRFKSVSYTHLDVYKRQVHF